MVICGLNLTHDGAVAVIDKKRLIFCLELEKLNNNPRYSEIKDMSIIPTILKSFGYSLSSIDIFAVDGWGGYNQDKLAIQPRLEIDRDHNRLSVINSDKSFQLDIAQYREKTLKDNVLKGYRFNGLKIGINNLSYTSYLHAAGHILSAYCTSPFSSNFENAYVLIWDGGMYPRLYYFDPAAKRIDNLGPIFLLVGNIYAIFSQHFGPFNVGKNFAKDDLSISGKVMAYVALGKLKRELFAIFDDIYLNHYDKPMGFANIFANKFKKEIKDKNYKDEDVLFSFHVYIEELLIKKLKKKIDRYGNKSRNLCFAGGCALNIKWNSAIRNSGLFNQVYIPPFPNDSGSAIGAACCGMKEYSENCFLDWTVYGGCEVVKNSPRKGWASSQCSIKRLAEIIHGKNEPIVLLNGRAELGPRALGNRSIVAPASSPKMKSILNRIKKREYYRPISPICLERKAKKIFDPGLKDPFMLFDHKVRMAWKDRIPAVIHLDGTARLQTVAPDENTVIGNVLHEYEKLSGIPLLCNTSANYQGAGFFPDIYSATKWGKVNYVWCDNILYEKKIKNIF